MKGLGPFFDWTPTSGGKLTPCANNFLHFFWTLTHIYELVTRKHHFIVCLGLYVSENVTIIHSSLTWSFVFCFSLNILFDISLLMDSGVIYLLSLIFSKSSHEHTAMHYPYYYWQTFLGCFQFLLSQTLLL